VELDETGGRLRVQTEANGSLVADFLLFATGRVPEVSFLPDEIINNNLEGVYFVGDVKNGLYRQAAIAAGDGLRAAMEIYHKLNSEAS
jgi:thioredoxin reductase